MKNLFKLTILLCLPIFIQAQSTDRKLGDLTNRIKITGVFGGVNFYTYDFFLGPHPDRIRHGQFLAPYYINYYNENRSVVLLIKKV